MKIEGLVGDCRCRSTEAFDSGVHDADPNIPFNPFIFSRQGNTDIGKGGGAAARASFVRRCIGWDAVQDSQGKAESDHIHVVIDGDRRAETGVGPAGAERQCEKGTNPSVLPAICCQGDSRMKAAVTSQQSFTTVCPTQGDQMIISIETVRFGSALCL